MDGNGMITNETSWFQNGHSVTNILNDTNLLASAPRILLIPLPFSSLNNGTYTCSPNSTFPTIPPGDNITLNAGGKYIMIYIALFI